MSLRTSAPRLDGFTLLEVMISLAILGTGALVLAAMQLQAVTQGAAGRHTGDAAAAGRSHLEQVHRLPWSDLDAAQAAGTWVDVAWAGAQPTVNTLVDTPDGTATEHSYDIDLRVTDVGVAPVCLRDVEIRVTWNEEDLGVPKSLILATRRYNWGSPTC